MNKKNVSIQEIVVKEEKTLGNLLAELGINHQYYAVLVDNHRITDLNTKMDLNSKIVILPKIRGG